MFFSLVLEIFRVLISENLRFQLHAQVLRVYFSQAGFASGAKG